MRSKGRTYHLDKFYTSQEEAREVIKNKFLGYDWLIKKTNDTQIGFTHWYHCKYKGCAARVQLVMNQIITGCTILYSDDEHNHTENEVNQVRIDTKTKEKIIELEACNMKPQQILVHLRFSTPKLPTSIKHFFERNKKK